MQAKELIAKALELSQLQWWLANPTVKSFFLCVESTSDDDGHYYIQIQNRNYYLTTDNVDEEDLDDDNDYFDYDHHRDFSTKTYYPVDINQSHYQRIYRPYPTDAEIQTRIDTILGNLLTQEELTDLVLNTAKNSSGLVRG